MEAEKMSDRPQPGDRVRRPYERPAIRWEEDFDPYAFSSCGKMAGGGCSLHMSS